MVRIWAKVMKEEKIIKDTIYEDFENNFDSDNFFNYIASICETMDIATPVILNKHLFHYVEFNTAIFLPSDFPEEVDFDKFVIEEASNY